jgi:predicted negative regulator of RcsB-dependent stress response
MANHLDLEEQEQLDQLKHFWKQYGNLITWALIAVLAAFAGWNGYQYWQRSQSSQAAALFDEFERMAARGDIAKVERAFNDMKERFPGTTYAQQTGLMAARLQFDAGKLDAAKAALTWVADKSADEGYQAIARLRLASLHAQARAFPEGMAVLNAKFPADFLPLVADRKGDILAMQAKPLEARAEYERAYQGLGERSEYRRLIEIKLNAMGVDPRAASAPAGTLAAASEAGK